MYVNTLTLTRLPVKAISSNETESLKLKIDNKMKKEKSIT